jgi:hypothetical protein
MAYGNKLNRINDIAREVRRDESLWINPPSSSKVDEEED